jgi:hypothetical protein
MRAAYFEAIGRSDGAARVTETMCVSLTLYGAKILHRNYRLIHNEAENPSNRLTPNSPVHILL